ncbi:hypothetical protein M569_04034, partial [Genlisea aurea]
MSGAPDFFCREAQRLGYVARSAFKLLQMQKRYKLMSPGSSVLDLGCAPGAWLQVLCQHIGQVTDGGVVVGIDTKKVKVPPMHCDSRVKTVCADVMKLSTEEVRLLSPQQKEGFSVVLSDMCPLISGIPTRDAALSVDLGMRALDLAVGRDKSCDGVLRRGGNLVIKFLESEDAKGFHKICKSLFEKSSWLRPKATRSCSKEIYLICQG